MTSAPEEQFERVAAAYADSPIHAQGPDLAWLLEALEPRASDRIVDLGTGAGHAALRVAPHVAEVTAVDLSAGMLAAARRLADECGLRNLTFLRADVAALPCPTAGFDGAISRYSAHHWAAPAGALTEAARVLRVGGRMVLVDTVAPPDPALDSFVNALELLRDASHGRDRTMASWHDALARAGFAVEAVREWAIPQATEAWLARAATPAWRADACRHLLAEAPSAARTSLAIAVDGSAWSVPAALFQARRLP